MIEVTPSHSAMTDHARAQLALALDAASAWDAPKLCGLAVADLVGQHLPADGERKALAGMIEEVLALMRKK